MTALDNFFSDFSTKSDVVGTHRNTSNEYSQHMLS